MKRKFAFDIPRLKFGSSKADNKTLRSHLTLATDSPPPSPKSVRPPLDAQTDAELRSACAYILQTYRPSHIISEGQSGSNALKPRLDTLAIKQSVHREVEAEVPPIPKLNKQEPKPAPTPAVETVIKDAKEAEEFDPEMSRFKSDTATEDLSKNEKDWRLQGLAIHNRPISRADQLTSSARSQAPVTSTRPRSTVHSQSTSYPVPLLAAPKADALERPRTAPRTDSLDTMGSTPQTDATEYPSSEKASTAMTSAVGTPARNSKRTSAQAPSSSESGSAPRLEPVDAEWMRQKSEKHKKAKEQLIREQQGTADDESEIGPKVLDVTPTQTSTQVTQATIPIKVRMPARKPLPSSRSASQQETYPRCTDYRQSGEQRRTESKQTYYTPQTGSSQHSETFHPESRQNERSEPLDSHARSVTREVNDFFRPSTAQRAGDSQDTSRPSSTSRSITQQVKEFILPTTPLGPCNPLPDTSSKGSRPRSIHSFRSSASDVAPSASSSTNNWRNLRPFHRKQQSMSGVPDVSRPGSSHPNHNSRGSTTVGDTRHSPLQPKLKSLNLNRELPPLPGLDQWKPVTPSSLEKPLTDIELSSPAIRSTGQDRQSVTPQPELGECDEILAQWLGSSTSPHSQEPLVDCRMSSIPMLPSAPPPALPEDSDALQILNDVLDDETQSPIALTPTIEPNTVSSDVKKEGRRSRSIQAAYLPVLGDKVRSASLGNTTLEKPIMTGKAQLVNYAHVSSGPINGNLGRKVGKIGHVAVTANDTPMSHSRDNSDHLNFSRKLSMDDYSRTYDEKYQNLMDIAATPPVPPKDKPRRKWWPGKSKREEMWMDGVIGSGSGSERILANEFAGVPIRR